MRGLNRCDRGQTDATGERVYSMVGGIDVNRDLQHKGFHPRLLSVGTTPRSCLL